ncbi:MAG: cysteine--tRNA ligase [Candidatus Symbiodolus clandestinus]
MFTLYNSLTRQKELFTPIHHQKIGLYVCGVTVYDLCHIGHARTFVNFDMVVRYLRYLGYSVTYIRNVTDIDDKIIQRAATLGETYQSLTQRMVAEMQQDFNTLQLLTPDQEPRATDHLPQMIALIEQLMTSHHAYIANDGDVRFAVNHYPQYGQLSQQPLEQLQIGARVENTADKQHPLDFVLWKRAKPDEPAWDSPWGRGRPGWHIECSAMNSHYLGQPFDIHGGGADLLFPHHENEIAQSCCATAKPYVNYWMHSGMVMVNQSKMAKSLGNFLTIRQILSQYNAETVRYFLLSSHYRSPLPYSDEHLQQAQAAIERLYTALREGDPTPDTLHAEDPHWQQTFCQAMSDDFNVPQAYAVLFDLAHAIQREKGRDRQQAQRLASTLRHLGGILGLLQQPTNDFLQGKQSLSDEQLAHIEQLIRQRQQARQQQDWAAADHIRQQLTALGITLQDGSQETTWQRSLTH